MFEDEDVLELESPVQTVLFLTSKIDLELVDD